MDARHPDEVTDAAHAAIDRELQAMLDVAPSREFAARVRTRIAAEPSPRRSWLGVWALAGGAAALAAIAIAAISVGRSPVAKPPAPALEARRASNVGMPLIVEREPFGRANGVEREPFTRATRAAHDRGPDAARQAAIRATAAEPQVLVDPREAAAIRALIAGTRDGRIDLAAVAGATTPSVMDLSPMADIEIPAITIDPIAPGTGEEGVRQ